jgi:hypothetical protein
MTHSAMGTAHTCGQRVRLLQRQWVVLIGQFGRAEPKTQAQDLNMAGTVSVAGRSNRMTIGLRPELQSAGAAGPRDPSDPPGRDRPEPPVHDPPANPPEPDQPFGDPTPLPGNDPPDPPMRV